MSFLVFVVNNVLCCVICELNLNFVNKIFYVFFVFDVNMEVVVIFNEVFRKVCN